MRVGRAKIVNVGTRLGIVATLAACLVAAGGWAPAALAAPAPHGQLTAQEYTVLSAANSALKKATHGNQLNQKAARAACLGVGSSTPLLTSERQDCFSLLRLGTSFEALGSAAHTCPKAAAKNATCLLPYYQHMASAAATYHKLEAAARQATVSRGFTGTCLLTLASSTKILGAEQKLVAATGKLASDELLLVQVFGGTAPPSKLKTINYNADENAFNHYVNLALGGNTPTKLRACPHQSD